MNFFLDRILEWSFWSETVVHFSVSRIRRFGDLVSDLRDSPVPASLLVDLIRLVRSFRRPIHYPDGRFQFHRRLHGHAESRLEQRHHRRLPRHRNARRIFSRRIFLPTFRNVIAILNRSRTLFFLSHLRHFFRSRSQNRSEIPVQWVWPSRLICIPKFKRKFQHAK